ncbi:MAG: DHH family phosphoesterase [Candidatus Peribacteraceae bacterium]
MTKVSLTGREWRFEERDAEDPGILLSRLAGLRSIDLGASAPLPFESTDHQPPDLARAIERLKLAFSRDERIAVFGDYDCDGITAAALMARFLARHGTHPLIRLPHRLHDGYGLKEENVRHLKDEGISLLITVDTGVSAGPALHLAKECGMDVIVIDHHHLPQRLPDTIAILHPLLAGYDQSPPSAAGLAYGVIAAYEREEGRDDWEGKSGDLALAATGTVADLVELRGTNRSLVTQGLAAFGCLSPDEPIGKLARQAGITGVPTSSDIAYRIAPRLNAAGRMADPSIALRAILDGDDALATLEQLNRDRQSETLRLLKDLDQSPLDLSLPLLLLADEKYPAGIVGLIAGRLTEAHGRPSFVAQIQGDVCTASLRSIPGYHITEALRHASDLLLSFGGHAMAAGCTFRTELLPQLTDRLLAHASERLNAAELRPILEIDAALDTTGVTLALCETLSKLEPFGQGNREPRFILSNVMISNMRRVGKDGVHLQARVGGLKGIGFRLGTLLPQINDAVDVACRLSIDAWEGKSQPQLLIEDVRAAEDAPIPTASKHFSLAG